MKIFAVYSRVHLTKKPLWLDGFYAKYARMKDFHVTLKQSCFLEEANIPNVKDTLTTFFSSFVVPEHTIPVTFNSLNLDPGSHDSKSIMINAEHNPLLDQLQRGVLSALDHYKRYVYPESQEWEEHFQPHITIAPDLDPVRYASALTEIGENPVCKGEIRDVALIIVDRMAPEEADRPEYQTIYHL